MKRIMSLGALRVFGVLLSFAQSVVLARYLGADLFGVYSTVISITTILAIVVGCGFDELIMRELAHVGFLRAKSNQVFLGIVKLAILLVGTLSFFVSISGYLLFDFHEVSDIYRIPLSCALLLFPLLIARKYSEAFAVGLKRQMLSFVGSKISFPLSVIFLCLAFSNLSLSPSPAVIAYIYSFGIIASTAVSILIVGKFVCEFSASEIFSAAIDFRVSLSSAALLSAVMVSNSLFNQIDTILLAWLSSASEAGYARVGQRMGESILLVQTILMIQYRPLLAEANGSGDQNLLKKHLVDLATVMSVLGLVLFVIVFFFAEYIIHLFGKDFSQAVPALRAYAIGSFSLMVAGPGTLALTMTRKEGLASRILACVLCINIALDFLFIPYFGSFGAGIATAVSQIILAATTIFVVRQQFGVEISILSRSFIWIKDKFHRH